jgi:hypothetical protein
MDKGRGVIYINYVDDDLYSKTTYIPLSNIGLLEKFDTMEDFYKEYPQIKEMKGE